jgi:hypothetical protein
MAKRTYPTDIPPSSGIPRPGELGESKREFWALIAAGVVILMIIIAFWIEAAP